MDKPILFTGFRPTGELHLGHYFSLIEPIIKNMDNYQIYVMIADLHAWTELRKNSRIDLCSMQKTMRYNIEQAVRLLTRFAPDLVIFRQSSLRQYHYDLFYKLLMVARHQQTFGNPVFIDAMRTEYHKIISEMKLEESIREKLRCFLSKHNEILWGHITLNTAVEMKKDLDLSGEQVQKIIKHLNTRVGVLGLATYPILMAADILLYKPAQVLIGSDQYPHIMITNDLIKIINKTFDLKVKPVEAMIHKGHTLKGSDGSKMSKTSGNYITINDFLDIDDLDSFYWVNKLKTFPRRKDQIGNPNECLAAEYYDLFDLSAQSLNQCVTADIGCKECKSQLHKMIRDKIQEAARYRPVDLIDLYLMQGTEMAKQRIWSVSDVLDLVI